MQSKVKIRKYKIDPAFEYFKFIDILTLKLVNMKDILLSRNKIKNFLSERLTQKVLQTNEESIFSMIRYEGIGGYSKISDNDLFVQLVEALPEFQLLQLINSDQNHIIVSLKPEFENSEDDILIDITRIIQMKLS